MSGIIGTVISWMLPFLKLFGIVERNGLSPFATSFNSPYDLSNAVKWFFCAPKADMRGSTSTNANVANEEVAEVEVEEEDVTDVDSNLSNGGNVDTNFTS